MRLTDRGRRACARLAAIVLAGLAFVPGFLPGAAQARSPRDYFAIVVQDADTGRGVPLVELRTVSEIRYYTDSNGIAAVGDPELMGQRVFFHVSSPGYTYPKDNFGYRGVALEVKGGARAVIKIKRENIAERLYRITGSGIYSDSVLAGLPAPLTKNLLDGQVFGQDTVFMVPYRGKNYWFFGDTNRPSYPLGQFDTSGATSELPGKGGLDPAVGVDLSYWVDANGFSRPMIPIENQNGPVWVGGLFTMKDKGRERLFTHFAEVDSGMRSVRSGLAEFNDEKAVFEPVCAYPLDNPLHPEGEPFLVRDNGVDYLYFETQQMGAFPLVRCAPDLAHVANPASYEAFTCLAPGTRYRKGDTRLDRDSDGKLIWGWKRNTPTVGEDEAKELVSLGKMRQDEVLTQLRDIDTDAFVTSHGGSVFWNDYRKRWIQITTQAGGSPSFLGEVWYAEADTPVGPWLYTRKIATHDHYTFYNPTQHPSFDQDGGRLIYFEGTYTNTFSDVKDLTPKYNYNQIMYRLDLSDPRLSLPAPVYRTKTGGGGPSYGMRADIQKADTWNRVEAIPFYAVPANLAHNDLTAVYAVNDSAGESGRLTLQTTAPADSAKPLFYGLPSASPPPGKVSPAIVPLYEYRDGQSGERWYGTDASAAPPSAIRSAKPLCFVWKNPSKILALDYGARPSRDAP